MKICILTLILWFSLPGIAQQKTNLRYTIGYFGEMLAHPGLNFGIEYATPQSQKHQMLLAANIGGYVHPKNNTSLFLRGQWGQRINFKTGYFINSYIGLGYLHQFVHGGESFQVQPNGAITKINDWGQPYFMPSIAIGNGWHFKREEKRPISFYLQPELFWKAPFNGYYLTHFSINAGLIF